VSGRFAAAFYIDATREACICPSKLYLDNPFSVTHSTNTPSILPEDTGGRRGEAERCMRRNGQYARMGHQDDLSLSEVDDEASLRP
jgi:hypothetical protein